ncbi:MAG: glycosyltransferase [Nodosilinea sp.]
MEILISAVICTFNRSTYVGKAVQSLLEQTLDHSQYEIIVVDNNSTDDTKAAIDQQFSQVNNLKYVFEKKVGLSQARNTGLAQAAGQYIAYLDDDAIAAPTWLERIVNCFQNIQPVPGSVGGKIEPIWESPRPEWLPDQFLGYLTIVDWSDAPFWVEKPKYIAGANMAFLRSVLDQVGGFNVALGRQGKKLLSNEELYLQGLIQKQGHGIYYDPAISVKHHVTPSRLTQSWFIQRLYWQGVSMAKSELQDTPSNFLKRLGLVARSLRKFVRKPQHLIYVFIPAKTKELFLEKCTRFRELGYCRGLLS